MGVFRVKWSSVTLSGVACLLGLIPGAPAPAAPSGAHADTTAGRIAYGRDGDIYTIRPDGSGGRRLTTTGDAGFPRWSPDGRRLAFLRRGDVYVMRADGGGTRRLTYGARTTEPAWSPDGRRIVAVRGTGSHTDLYRIALAGGSPRRLTRAADKGCDVATPTWQGMSIVFVRTCPSRPGKPSRVQLRLLDLRSGRQSVVLDATVHYGYARGPRFTARGAIMFLGCVADRPYVCGPGRHVYVMNLDGSGLRIVLAGGGTDGDPNNTSAAPSPVDEAAFVVEWSAPSGDSDDDRTEEGLDVCIGECRALLPGSRDHSVDDPDWQPLQPRTERSAGHLDQAGRT
ncbi:TolB family protein [Nucisporomicrobium flavum]|uniref:TolB family protein n=1 Tax=Nucisporomicrobium flavum TaxID=2785915 RepID=UPI0018F67903|nr:PD40 domain-containing protein [Nucisporomicrobium flavum]